MRLADRLLRLPAFLGGVACALTALPAAAITISFDFTYDTSGFFSGVNVARRDVLQQAAAEFSSRLTDSLTAIVPVQGNTWTASFTNPSSAGTSVSLPNLSIGANTVVIYVGATDLGAGVFAQGRPGAALATGDANWLSTVATRGQAGALSNVPTDFGPWGGAISFNSAVSWHSDSTPATIEPFPGQFDLYTVALREIGHVLGFGTAASWSGNILHTGIGNVFAGANAVATFGGVVSLAPDNTHWQAGTLSTALGSGSPQAAVMNPDLAAGTRNFLTAVDLAGLQDVGWTVVPEASTLAWAGVIGAAGLWRWRRARKS